MKQFKLIQAYRATDALSHNDKLSADTLWGIYFLRKKLFPHWEFQTEREEALKKKYSKYADENGTLKGDNYLNYVGELTALANIEKEIAIDEKIKIVITDDLGLTVEMMEALEDFVEFEKERSE